MNLSQSRMDLSVPDQPSWEFCTQGNTNALLRKNRWASINRGTDICLRPSDFSSVELRCHYLGRKYFTQNVCVRRRHMHLIPIRTYIPVSTNRSYMYNMMTKATHGLSTETNSTTNVVNERGMAAGDWCKNMKGSVVIITLWLNAVDQLAHDP